MQTNRVSVSSSEVVDLVSLV